MNFIRLPRGSSNYTGNETAANLNSANATTVTVKAKWTPRLLSTYIINLTNGAPNTSTSVIGSTNLAYDNTGDKNLRYVGAANNNYIQFNGETWRIIGVFNSIKSSTSGNKEKRVKIVRPSNLGTRVYNNPRSGDWATSQLNSYLNGTYYPSLSSQAKTLATDAYWNTGACNKNMATLTAKDLYDCEFSTATCTGCSSYHVNKVALIYNSDFGYASTACKDGQYGVNTSYCKNTSTNWLYFGVQMWTLDSHTGNPGVAGTVYISGNGHYADQWDYSNDSGNYVYPSLYLDAGTIYNGGNGTSSNPYKITI